MKTDITAKIYKKAFGVDLDDKDVNKHVKAVIIMQILHAKSMQGMSCYVFLCIGQEIVSCPTIDKAVSWRLHVKYGLFVFVPDTPEDAGTLSCGNTFRHPSANGIMGL